MKRLDLDVLLAAPLDGLLRLAHSLGLDTGTPRGRRRHTLAAAIRAEEARLAQAEERARKGRG